MESAALLDRLRAAAPGTLVVACDVPNPLSRARAAGADAYLIKPVSQQNLSSALGSLSLPVRSLLIVDDEPDGAEMISRLVRKLDPSIGVSMVHAGALALAAMRARHPDLVMLDVAMPEDDGWSVLASMREDPSLASVPVFFVSGVDPSDTPPVSDTLTVTVDGGIPIGRLLSAALELSKVLLARET